jgi:tRNA A-37 threonylcarbamoyl transferase component Bud32
VELIARGREAEIHALDDRRALRRYGEPRRVDAEHRLMEYPAGQGFPVPAVYEFTDTDLVVERLAGPTMAEALGARTCPTRRPGFAHGASGFRRLIPESAAAAAR